VPTIKAPDVDSLCYVFAYLIRSERDLPADFPIPESARDFQVGVFRCVSTTLRQSAWEFSDFPAQPKAVLAC
jgi:hypothetical protein